MKEKKGEKVVVEYYPPEGKIRQKLILTPVKGKIFSTKIIKKFILRFIDSIKSGPIEVKGTKKKKILELLKKKGSLKTKKIAEGIDSSLSSANNLLKDLMEDGLIEREKVKRTYEYMLSEKMFWKGAEGYFWEFEKDER